MQSITTSSKIAALTLEQINTKHKTKEMDGILGELTCPITLSLLEDPILGAVLWEGVWTGCAAYCV